MPTPTPAAPPRAAPPTRRVHPAALRASGILLASGIAGLANAIRNIPVGRTGLQTLVAVSTGVYGVAGLAALVGLWRCRPWTFPVVLAWGAACAVAAGVAPVAYGGPDVPPVAGASSGLGALLVAAFVAWLVRRALRVS